MKRVLLVCILSLVILSACGKTYSSEDYNNENLVDIADIYADPVGNTGKSVNFYMKVFSVDEREGERWIQGYTNSDFSDQDVIVGLSSDREVGEIKEGDYVYVEGVDIGAIDGETAMGVQSTWAQVNGTAATKVVSYIEAVSPTKYSMDINKKVEQNNVAINVKKFEESPIETRLYLEIDNESKNKYTSYEFDYTLIVDGKQYDVESNYDADYEEYVNDIQPGVNVQTMLTFPQFDIENAKSIKLNIESGSSSNYDIEFDDKTLKIK